jgi:hypothetical protein
MYDVLIAYAEPGSNPGIEIVDIGLLGGDRTVCSIPDDPGLNETGEMNVDVADYLLVEYGFRRMYSWQPRDNGLWVAIVTPAEDA